MKKLLSQLSKVLIIISAAVVINGCGKKSVHNNFVARVNNTYLTKAELAGMIDTSSAGKLYKSEVIRNWINRELLYQTAVKKGILKEEKFKRIIDDSKKELAASMLVQEYYENEKVSYGQDQIENYFNRHKNDFVRFYDSYYLNEAVFNDEDKAIQFRQALMESDWNNAVNVFKGEASILRISTGVLLYNYQIMPVTIFRIVSGMYPGEISTVINDEAGRYTVIQEIQKYDKGTVPPFEVVKKQAEDRFIAEERENLIRNYIKDLYSNNEIEVRN